MTTSPSRFLLLLAMAVGRSTQYCAPECGQVDPGSFVRDPTDCTRYYVCLMINGEMVPSEESVPCPDGEYFEDGHTVPQCDPIDNAPSDFCSDLCNPCVPDCHADNPGTVQPHESDCSKYYVCLASGHSLEETCPSDYPYFDFKLGNCQTDSTLCYDYCDPCVPHCIHVGEQVPDPKDCTKFYLCSPPNMASFQCPNNQTFSHENFQCEEDVPCIVLCPDMI